MQPTDMVYNLSGDSRPFSTQKWIGTGRKYVPLIDDGLEDYLDKLCVIPKIFQTAYIPPVWTTVGKLLTAQLPPYNVALVCKPALQWYRNSQVTYAYYMSKC